jgi:biopolymer transport protein ExbD
MNLIPDDELRRQGGQNLAPMVDFLFLVIAVFAVLAVTRTALYDNDLNLVKVHTDTDASPLQAYNDFYTVHLSVTKTGEYKWIAENREFLMDSVPQVCYELSKQQELGLLPHEKDKTKVLLHIDKEAEWEPIAQLIFGVRGAGFQIHPVYE